MLIAFHVAMPKKSMAVPNQTKSLASLTLRQPLPIEVEPGEHEETDVAQEKKANHLSQKGKEKKEGHLLVVCP